MKILFATFLRIALLRSGPQVLPTSRPMTVMLLMLHLGGGMLLASGGTLQPLVAALMGTTTMVAFVHGVLLLHRLTHRFLQTLAALAGSELIIGVLALLLRHTLPFGNATGVTILLALLLLAWNVALAAHILRHALDLKRRGGFIYGVGYMALSIVIVNSLEG